MSISSYSELKTAVENWLDRDDLSDRVEEFISLAETRLYRRLMPRAFEERSYTPLVAGQEYYSLPTDFLYQRNVQINTNPVNVLKYMTPEQLDKEYPNTGSGVPAAYTIIGNEIQIKPIPSSTDNLEIAYFQKLPALSATNTTNWTLTNAPDLLLYGSLIEAEAYLVNDPRIGIWKAAFDEGLQHVNALEMRARHSGNHLEMRTGTRNP